MNIDEYKQEVLDDINNCFSSCSDIQSVCFSKGVPHDVDWLVSHLPALDYVRPNDQLYVLERSCGRE